MKTLTCFQQCSRFISAVLVVLLISGCNITISEPIDQPAALLPINTPTTASAPQKNLVSTSPTATIVIKTPEATGKQKARSTVRQAAQTVTATATTVRATATTISTRKPIVHVVREGDTLTGIMAQYDISLKALLGANSDLSEYGYLSIDQEIIIPPDDETDQQEEIVMQASSSPFPSPSPSPSPFPTNTPTPNNGPPRTKEGHIIHFVQVGETISQIAAQYNVARNDILLANGLRPDTLLIAGDTLIIPQGSYTALPTATPPTPTAVPTLDIVVETTVSPSPTATSTELVNSPTPESTRIVTYTIASGDLASIIANQYDVTLDDLQTANPAVNLDRLTIGEEILIPPPSEDKEEEENETVFLEITSTPTAITIEPSATPTPIPPIMSTHVVKAGETLQEIAEENELPEEALREYNPDIEATDQELEEEMVVQIPVGTATQTPSATPMPTLTPTPAPAYLAPILILPANGEKLVYTDTKTLQLTWTSPGILQQNEYYVVRLRALDEQEQLLWSYSEWTNNPFWEVPDELLAQIEGEVTLKWDVLVMRLTSEVGVEPKTGEALSDKSETYELIYVRHIPNEQSIEQ